LIGGQYLDGFSGGWMGSVDCKYLAQYRERWLAVVNQVMNLRVP
jgi:hypothetical protein